MKRGMVALIGMILALVFIIVALFGPWYGLSVSGSPTGNFDASMSLTSSTYTQGGTTTTTSNADARKTATDTAAYDISDITLYLTIFALIVAILAVILILGYVFNFGKPNMMKNLGMIFVVITFVLALVAVFYFMTAVPGTNSMKAIESGNTDFWYSKSVSGASLSMGPGFAWYLMLVAGIIALISFIFVFMDKKAAPVYQNPAP